ncbi:MAG: nitroreductase family protein [Rhodospirillales bacterium]
MADKALKSLQEQFVHRFGEAPPETPLPRGAETIQALAARRSHRKYLDRPVEQPLIETLSAAALCAPTKSDLQQTDIVIIEDAQIRNGINGLFSPTSWVAAAPALLVFCANNRRQRQLHAWRGRPFANDHLDAFFNATVDSAIVLATFVVAAEAVGLGYCPLSAIRNDPERVSELLSLPDHVFPVAGLTLGWPADDGAVSLRLPLDVTVHRDRFGEDDLRQRIDAYDRRRANVQPIANQKFTDQFGAQEFYGWSEDKARQYTEPQRTDFGAFVRAKGFKLE